MEAVYKIFIGNIVHSKGLDELEVLEPGVMVVKGPRIVVIDQLSSLEQIKKCFDLKDYEEIKLTDTQILIPGLIDTHIHASQFPNLGLGYDKQLLDWLNTYTFPLEKKYGNVEFAKKIYSSVIKNTLAHGTTTAMYFATLHVDSTIELANIAIEGGQRAFIGKVNMTENCPDDLTETEEASIENTEKFVQAILSKQSDLVKPVITPRFAVSCTEKLMLTLADIAKKYDLNIQSHLSENLSEIEFVKKIFGKGYAEVYDDCGLLTRKTVMAHGVHLTDPEIQLLSKKKTSVSHCPGSNCALQSGNCDVKALLKGGVNVALGTDVSGGPSPSIIEAMRASLRTSINIKFRSDNNAYNPLNCYDAFYLATLGGAKALALEDKIGNFVVGKDFDALLVDMKVDNAGVPYLEKCSVLELLQKFIYTADDRNVLKVYVAGKQVKN